MYRFDANGNELNHWHMDPLEKSIKGVNPPFVYCMERSEHDGSVFCGCGDGSIRQLLSTEKGDRGEGDFGQPRLQHLGSRTGADE